MFPDAPTVRGTRHILEMIDVVNNKYKGYILFLVQLKGVKCFTPNKEMDPEFDAALKKLKVRVLKYLFMIQ